MATQKASERRVILRIIQNMVQQMIEANELVFKVGKELEKTDEPDAQIKAVCDAILTAMGPPAVCTAEETTDTMCAGIVNLLNGQATDDTYGLLDWEYLKE